MNYSVPVFRDLTNIVRERNALLIGTMRFVL